MKYTIFAYEMICIMKRSVTLNKYARNFNFHNEMKATITRSHSHVELCLPQLHETHQACIYIYKNEICNKKTLQFALYIYKKLRFHKKMKRHTKSQMTHDKFSAQICSSTTPALNYQMRGQYILKQPSCDWSVLQPRQSCDLRQS